MDVIPSEMFRGHLDTIILLSLLNEDKHTNQIRDEIEVRSDGKFELKQGTFYSCLQRIVKQGLVTEYRASSPDDGVRRKFYQLTEKGKNYIDENKDKWENSRAMVNTLLETPEAKKVKKVEKPEPATSEPPQIIDFDIDKALKDFLNSEDTPKQETPVEPAPVTTVVTPAVQVTTTPDEVNVNVQIINLSDISQKSQKDEFVEPNSVQAVQPVEQPKPAPKEQPKPVQQSFVDITNSPEEYDIYTLIGLQPSSKPAQTEIVVEKPIEQKPVESQVPVESIQTESVEKSPAKIEENPPQTTTYSEPLQKERNQSQFPTYEDRRPKQENVYREDEDDYFDGTTTVTHDYKPVLQRMLETQSRPTKTQDDSTVIIYTEGTDINQFFGNQNNSESTTSEPAHRPDHKKEPEKKHVKERPEPPVNTQPVEPEVATAQVDTYDFSDIQSMAKIEGFKVSISTGSVKHKVNSILINKLICVSSWIYFALVLLQLGLLYYFTSPISGVPLKFFAIFAGIVALFPITSLIIYFVEPKKKVGSIPTLRSIIELCIVIMLNMVLIMIVFAILAEVDFSSAEQMLKYVLYPSIVILNVPIYFIIKYLNLEHKVFYN